MQAMFLQLEIARHAALLFYPAPERHAQEIAFQIVSPLMIGAHDFRRVAELFLAELHAAMGAFIEYGINAAVFVAREYDGFIADKAAFEIARLGNLCGQAGKAPACAAEDF